MNGNAGRREESTWSGFVYFVIFQNNEFKHLRHEILSSKQSVFAVGNDAELSYWLCRNSAMIFSSK